jgi:hypothetical protein
MKWISLVVVIFLAGCCCPGYYKVIVDPRWVRKIDAEELTRTTVRYTTKLNREYGLTLEDSRAYYTECTEKIRLVFSSQKCPEIPEARELLVDVVEGYLNAVNNNPSIRADLCTPPFTFNDLEIYINFESYFSEYVDPFYVGCIELDEGLAVYYMATQKEWYYDRWNSRFEPYTKSVEIARAQREANMIYPRSETIGTQIEQPTSTVIIDATPWQRSQFLPPSSPAQTRPGPAPQTRPSLPSLRSNLPSGLPSGTRQ